MNVVASVLTVLKVYYALYYLILLVRFELYRYSYLLWKAALSGPNNFKSHPA
jgi:hypothetical protein